MSKHVITLEGIRCTCGNHSPGRSSEDPKPEAGTGRFGSIIVEKTDNSLHAGINCQSCGAVFAVYGDQEVLNRYSAERREQWDELFCPKCEWNLKGVAPHRYCTHCKYTEGGQKESGSSNH